MHAVEVFLILIFNVVFIYILYSYQKRLVEKSVRHLKDEVQELEDLVAAIIEEFEEIAAVNENNPKSSGILPRNQDSGVKYPTVDDLLSNFDANEIDMSFGVESIADNEFVPKNSTTETRNENNQPQIYNESQIHFEDELKVDEDNETEIDETLLGEKTPVPKLESILNPEFISDPKHRQILDLWQQGMSIEEIARKLGKGRGEVQLILGIYRRS